ncbi:hypothetical protein BDV12DRAFT_156200 [Aspergillus spectabilis]
MDLYQPWQMRRIVTPLIKRRMKDRNCLHVRQLKIAMKLGLGLFLCQVSKALALPRRQASPGLHVQGFNGDNGRRCYAGCLSRTFYPTPIYSMWSPCMEVWKTIQARFLRHNRLSNGYEHWKSHYLTPIFRREISHHKVQPAILRQPICGSDPAMFYPNRSGKISGVRVLLVGPNAMQWSTGRNDMVTCACRRPSLAADELKHAIGSKHSVTSIAKWIAYSAIIRDGASCHLCVLDMHDRAWQSWTLSAVESYLLVH